MNKATRIYFASDAHLGMHPREKSAERERIFVQWLESIRKDATEIYLVGDIFDYWFEYRKVVPRGFTRFLGKISEITDSGIPVHFFTGNHDVWVFDYLPSETGVTVHREPCILEHGDQRLFIAHGDGLGPGERGYKLLKRIFTSKVLQWLYARIHPNASMAFAHRWSRQSRFARGIASEFMGEDREVLIRFARTVLRDEHFDFFIFGHRHIPLVMELEENSRLVYLGDWIGNFTFAVYDGSQVVLNRHDPVTGNDSQL